VGNRGILNGIRVLELGHAVAGPAAGLILSDLGAEVIKIEKPGKGDIFRNLPGMGHSIFVAINRGKKSVALDLGKPDGYKLFLELVKISDVIVDNLDPEASRKLSVGYDRLVEVNPRIIYCKITGFGEGPYGKLPAYDPMLQAISGIMSVTGIPPDTYVRSGISLVDMAGAFNCVMGVLAALYRRILTGKGAYIEVSLFDSAVYYMNYWVSYYDLFKRIPEPLGSGHIFASPYGLFKTADGYIYLSIVSDEHWRKFCETLGFYDLLSDPKYRTNQDRVAHKKELELEVERRLKDFRTSQLFKVLAENGIPAAPLYTVDKLLEDPHASSRGVIGVVECKEGGVRTTLNPLVIDGTRYARTECAPRLGEDTEYILKSLLNISDDVIRDLREKGVIG
jgi:formyl-CoA transferase